MSVRTKRNVLVITEKPRAAQRIAHILKQEDLTAHTVGSSTYYELERQKERLFVVSALGHLYNLKEKRPSAFKRYPTFSVYWAKNTGRGRKGVPELIELIGEISSGVDEVVVATDYDIEGSIIGFNTVRFACGEDAVSKASRMKFSSLTKDEILDAYENRTDHLDMGQTIAGMTRHVLDFVWGINLTRILTLSARDVSGFHNTISVGRVQGPALRFMVNRERKVLSYIPLPYWEMRATLDIRGERVEAGFAKGKLDNMRLSETILGEVRGHDGQVTSVKRSLRRYGVRPPFDLTALQSQAYSNFKFAPSRTMRIAAGLYLEGMITYPRTSSQKFPPTLDHREILEGLSKIRGYKKLAKKVLSFKELKPKEGKKTDPAHPAIHPTGTVAERTLRPDERKVFDLIVRRYLACFSDPVVKENVKVVVGIGAHDFFFTGSRIAEMGWLEFYGKYSGIRGKDVPIVEPGETVEVAQLVLEEKYVSPPARFNQRSLLVKMEEEGIGTKTTRAGIIDTLIRRRYVVGEQMRVSELGLKLVETLEESAPQIISVKLTREMQQSLDRIYEQDSDAEGVLLDALDRVLSAIRDLRAIRKPMGEELDRAVHKVLRSQRILGTCPDCKTGTLMIIRSRRTGKRFVGCSNYSEGCRASMPLPQSGVILSSKDCEFCGWAIIKVKFTNRFLTSCVNLDCESRIRKKA